jgi:hypothetical protein
MRGELTLLVAALRLLIICVAVGLPGGHVQTGATPDLFKSFPSWSNVRSTLMVTLPSLREKLTGRAIRQGGEPRSSGGGVRYHALASIDRVD